MMTPPCSNQRLTRVPPRHGFTLVEVLVVLAVLAILALIAVPSQVERIVREQVVKGLALADVAKAPVAQAWLNEQTWPADNAALQLPEPDRIVNEWVSAVAVEDGVIHLRFGHKANGALQQRTLTLRPAVVADAPVVPVVWVCAAADPPPPMQAHGIDRTDLPVRYLPAACR